MEILNILKCFFIRHNYALWHETTVNYLEDGSKMHDVGCTYLKCNRCSRKSYLGVKTKINHVIIDLNHPNIDYSTIIYGDDNTLLMSGCVFSKFIDIQSSKKFSLRIITNNIYCKP